jgi:general secretion pathway protein H
MIQTRRYEGFTLIEVLLVILLLSLAAALSAPRFKTTWTGIQYDRQVTRFINVIRYARTQSRADNCVYKLVYDPQRHSYYLERREAGDQPAHRKFRKIHSRFGYEIKLDDTIELETAHNQLVIFPGGATTGGRFEFTAGEQRKTIVQVAVLTGQVSVE